MAATLLREISQDERERAILRSRRMYETDMTSDRLASERKGEMRGIKKGLKQGIKKGLEAGQNQVLELLTQKLSAEEIEEIKFRLQR